MGKTAEKQTNTSSTQYSLTPMQQQIQAAAAAKFMPNGQLPTSSPEFNYNDSPELQNRGANFVAPFSDPSLQAFQQTYANYGAERPTMDAAKGKTWQGGQAAGQFQGAPDGWTTNPWTGQAEYQDYATGVQRYMSPFISGVIGQGLTDLDFARQKAVNATNNDTVSKGSFGGTRQAVRQGENDRDYATAAERLITGNLQKGYESAQGQYNTGFTQGQQALGYNTGVEQANRAAALASGKQLGDQALQSQQLTGNDINALRNVGVAIEDKDQAQRDAARASQLQDETWGLNIAQMLWGLNPPPSSTTNSTSQKVIPSSSIWGTIGASAAQGAAAAAMMPSDERAKGKVEDADPHDALAEIRKLVPKTYDYTADAKRLGAPEGRRTGFMAQDLERATGKKAPHWAGGYKGVDIMEHVGRLTQAVQALDIEMRERYGGKRKAA